jgi:hypothetical protein
MTTPTSVFEEGQAITDKVIEDIKARIAAAVKTDQTWRETLGMDTAAASKEIARAMHLCSLTVQAVCSNPNVGMMASAYEKNVTATPPTKRAAAAVLASGANHTLGTRFGGRLATPSGLPTQVASVRFY